MLAGLGKIKGASLGSSGSARFSGFREFLPGRRTAAGGAAPKEPKIFASQILLIKQGEFADIL